MVKKATQLPVVTKTPMGVLNTKVPKQKVSLSVKIGLGVGATFLASYGSFLFYLDSNISKAQFKDLTAMFAAAPNTPNLEHKLNELSSQKQITQKDFYAAQKAIKDAEELKAKQSRIGDEFASMIYQDNKRIAEYIHQHPPVNGKPSNLSQSTTTPKSEVKAP